MVIKGWMATAEAVSVMIVLRPEASCTILVSESGVCKGLVSGWDQPDVAMSARGSSYSFLSLSEPAVETAEALTSRSYD